MRTATVPVRAANGQDTAALPGKLREERDHRLVDAIGMGHVRGVRSALDEHGLLVPEERRRLFHDFDADRAVVRTVEDERTSVGRSISPRSSETESR